MSKLNDLIQQLCPGGVEYRKLGEVAEIRRGGSLQKRDFVEDNENAVPCIHYGQIYTRYGLEINRTVSSISKENSAKQQFAQSGDIVMAVTSENFEDVCKSLVWNGQQAAAVSGHTAIINFRGNPKFLVYYFSSDLFRKSKRKLVHGTKVIEVTPRDLERIWVPYPPLKIQQEIVKILDKLTKLQAELQAELDLRLKQYEYWRDELLSFDNIMTQPANRIVRLLRELCPNGVEYKKLGEIGEFFGGLSGKSKKDFETDCNAKYVTYTGLFNNLSINDSCLAGVRIDKNERQNALHVGDIIFTGSSETPNEVAYSSVMTHDFDEDIYLNSFCMAFRTHDKILLPEFAKHLFRSRSVRKQLIKTAMGVTRFNVSKERMKRVEIPIPPIAIQEQIADILDKFSAYTTSLTDGLPAEIELRQKQYGYYRDKLLSFTPAE